MSRVSSTTFSEKSGCHTPAYTLLTLLELLTFLFFRSVHESRTTRSSGRLLYAVPPYSTLGYPRTPYLLPQQPFVRHPFKMLTFYSTTGRCPSSVPTYQPYILLHPFDHQPQAYVNAYLNAVVPAPLACLWRYLLVQVIAHSWHPAIVHVLHCTTAQTPYPCSVVLQAKIATSRPIDLCRC